jgi:hypothetical protein
MTRRQSNNESCSGIAAHPAPKKFGGQKSSVIFLASIVVFIWGKQDGILLINYFPKRQTTNAENYLSMQVQFKEFLKQKRHGNFNKASGSCTTIPRVTGHLHTRKNWPTCASSILTTLPILRIWSRQTAA